MNIILLLLQIAAEMPIIQWGGAPPAPAATVPHGTGTVIIAACQPGELIILLPGPLSANANDLGVAIFTAPATDTPYIVRSNAGAQELNGPLKQGQAISGVCL